MPKIGKKKWANPEKSRKLENGQREFPQKQKSVIYDEKKISRKYFLGNFLEPIALYLTAKN